MSKRQLIMLFGALIILIALFSGLPTAWNTSLYVIIGILIIAVAYTTVRPASSAAQKKDAPYVDTRGSSPAMPPAATPEPEPVVEESIVAQDQSRA